MPPPRHRLTCLPCLLQTLSDSPPTSYSDQKWNAYGTRERLVDTRRNGLKPEAQASRKYLPTSEGRADLPT